jgi:hypothetical protein
VTYSHHVNDEHAFGCAISTIDISHSHRAHANYINVR